MPKFNDKELAVARLYARSILDLASRQGSEEATLGELAELADLARESRDFGRLLRDPLLGTEAVGRTLETLFRGKLSDLTVDALQVMRRKGRLALVPEVAETFRREHQAARGIVDVHVVSAVPLSPALKERLAAAVDRHTGRRSHLVETVDPDILGGLVVRVGDEKIDTSVARELSRLGGALLARASSEILSGKAYTAEEAT